ncbi:phosphoenolpyruvate carboxykinase (ATP) [Sulfurospirillum arcachonense]|uniref:phosphoenolpyruvate carboxykinase (ATP) n=1 Tax=Sulfurospirillum arcachonense TaxID=57666 RepID=UPI000468EDA9|nr:phosphoenolpyruvate carboxykinase (ATP) [Sulfurospirillum arcachonense]
MSKVNGLENLGLTGIKEVYHNLSYDELFEHEQRDPYGQVTKGGTFAVDTGIFTGRSPKDKYFVNQDPSNKYISWGEVNKPVSKEIFDELFSKVKKQLSDKNVYVQDAYCGGAPESRKSIRVVTEIAWQAHFVKNMFIRPPEEDLANFTPDFTLYNAGKLNNKDYEKHGLHSDVFVVFNVEENIAIIGGTWYGGEMKKGVFSMMNYWLPLEGKLSMHCSANVGADGDTALFFGLSGTGKTTLSTDPRRRLIGDDEHGWDDKGVFNFEGGCYAKCIGLDPQSEPEIYGAIKRNALLENVVIDKDGKVDYKDGSKTENTRVSYPIDHIKNHKRSLKAPHPKKIIFLTADAFGVLPPVSRLTKEQAMYYFMSGYTAKVAGTERGVTEPVATFSSCFGEAFLPLHPTVYAKLLGEKIDKHGVDVYLVNTGWTGGTYGVGTRMSIKATRSCINSILDGSIEKSEFEQTPVFGLSIPKQLQGVDTLLLNPKNTWKNKSLFDASQKELAEMFIQNFKKYITDDSDFSSAGPKL